METNIVLDDKHTASIKFDENLNVHITVRDKDDYLKEIFSLGKIVDDVYIVAYGNTDVSDEMTFRVTSEDLINVFKLCGSEVLEKHKSIVFKYITAFQELNNDNKVKC